MSCHVAVNSGEDIIDEVNILVLKVKAEMRFFQYNVYLDPKDGILVLKLMM